MNLLRSLVSTALFATVAGVSGIAAATNNIQLLYNGLAAPNLASPPNTQAFSDWCAGVCFPTTQQTVRESLNKSL